MNPLLTVKHVGSVSSLFRYVWFNYEVLARNNWII